MSGARIAALIVVVILAACGYLETQGLVTLSPLVNVAVGLTTTIGAVLLGHLPAISNFIIGDPAPTAIQTVNVQPATLPPAASNAPPLQATSGYAQVVGPPTVVGDPTPALNPLNVETTVAPPAG